MKGSSIVVFLCFILLLRVYPQEMHFRYITDKDGLISNNINVILEDSQGFMWFGTNNGLCRYDGYSFLNYFYSPTDSQTLSNNNVTSIVEDKNNNLWVGTSAGLNILNLETYKIKRFSSFNKHSNTSLVISVLQLNGLDKLWIGTYYSGLYMLDIESQQVINHSHSQNNAESLVDNAVYCLLEDDNRGLFVGTGKGLDVFDPHTSTFKRVIEDIDVRSLYFSRDGSILLGVISNGNEYLKLNFDYQFEAKKFPFEFGRKIVQFHIDSYGNQWTSIRDNGLIYTDANSNQSRRLLFDKYKPDGINSNTITRMYEDRLGNIWFGTFDAGICIYERNRKAFIHVKDNFLPNGLQNNRVRSIYQDSEGDIWIGTKIGGALSKFDRQTQTFTHYRHNDSNRYSICDDLILCITEDKPGYLWVGTSNGLNLFEKRTGKSKTILHDPQNRNSISSDLIYALLKEGDQLYIGNVLDGLDIYDTKNKTFEHNMSSNKPGSISNGKVRVLYKDSKSQIWVGTANGLNLYNKDTKKFTHYLNNSDDTTSLSDNSILCIHEDADQNLWIGTGLGLNLLNFENNTFQTFTTKDGLPGNSINGILNDKKGNLWISTNNGISKFNYTSMTIKNYNVYDGLQANEFSLFSYCGTKEGEMLFGGNNGFTMFYPDQVTDNQNIPEVLITNFKLFNKEVIVGSPESPLEKHISHCDEITLNHKQSVFTFEYVALNYSSTDKNQYAYKLEGFDTKSSGWNYVGAKREVTYTNLDPGEYVFRVKASNNDGLWNESGASLKINILPRWYETTLVRILAFLFFVGLIVGLYCYKLNELRKQKLILEQKVDERTEELQIQKNKINAIIENIPDPIYYKDRDSRFVVCNSALSKIFDLNPEEVIGKTDFDFHDEQDAQKYFVGEQELMQTGVSIINLEEHNPYNENKKIINIEWLLVTKVPLRDSVGNVIGMIGINRDITDQKHIEENLRNSEQRLKELNADKDRFMSIMAHDLKNPFNCIVGLSEVLVIQVKERKFDEIEKYAEIIQQSSQQIMDLLTNLMEWSRSQTGRMRYYPEKIELSKLINEIILLFKENTNQKSINLQNDLPSNLIVKADIAMISTVLRNLISNAIKFTPVGGKIIVSTEEKTDEIIVTVADNGVGISKSSIEKLFRIDENFSTPGTQNEIGTGLGLILCKEFVEKHGGKIWVESNTSEVQGQEKGSTFYFTLTK